MVMIADGSLPVELAGGELCLCVADLEAEELGSICEASRDALQGSFSVGNKSSIVCKEEGQPLLGLGVGLKAL